MEPRNSTELIVIHCAATKASMDVDAATIRDWHVNGNGWRDIRDSGAHAAGYNHKSIGICLVGGMADDNSAENNFTDHQWIALLVLVKELQDEYPDANVIGHNEISEKECPSFDVQEWKRDNL